MNKYFIEVPKESSGYPKGSMTYYHPNLMVEISLSASSPDVEITFDKLKSRMFSKPVSTSSLHVKATLKEEYEKYLKRNLGLIRNAAWGMAEFYYISTIDVFEVSLFNLDKKNLYSIHIKICNNHQYGSVSIDKNSSYSRRRWFRRDGEAITAEQFRNILELVYSYALDEGSYEINIGSLEAKIKFLISGEMLVPDARTKQRQDFIEKLEQKIQQLQARLIDNDSDTPIDCATLRGELAGVDYAERAYKYNLLNS